MYSTIIAKDRKGVYTFLNMDEVDQIRDKTDIVSLISEYVTVKKAGRNFKANCPFHNEKTPSFVISPERQIWHCFGSCNKGGDAYSFVMEYEKVDFPEALRMLAKRSGIELSQSRDTGVTSSQKESFYRINALAKEYYHYILTKHKAGEKALSYLKKRGINEKLIESFKVGFAPRTQDGLVKYLTQKKKHNIQDVIEAGLAFKKGVQPTDFFWGRLIFPLVDHRDNVVGFSGRILDNNSSVSKYINTRETLVYHKSDHVFGLNITKESIRRENQVIITEGEFDVMACYKNGIGNVVAVKGTALTEAQVNLIGRFAEKITFCFDTDKAGLEAIKRSIGVVEKKGLSPTVIEIVGGKDADEALLKNPTGFKKAAKEDVSVYEFLIKKALELFDVNIADGKKKFSNETLPYVAQIGNEIIKEHYLKKIAKELDTSYESIQKEVERIGKKIEKTEVKIDAVSKRPQDEILEEYLLALILQSDNRSEDLKSAIQILSDTGIAKKSQHKIMDKLSEFLGKNKKFDADKFINTLPQELLSSYDTSFLFPLPEFSDEKHYHNEVEKIAKNLKTIYVRERLKEVSEEIRQKERDGKEKDIEKLQKEYSALVANLG